MQLSGPRAVATSTDKFLRVKAKPIMKAGIPQNTRLCMQSCLRATPVIHPRAMRRALLPTARGTAHRAARQNQDAQGQ